MNKLSRSSFIISLLALCFTAHAQYIPVEENPLWDRPVIVPLPEAIAGISNPVRVIGTEWESSAPQQAGTTVHSTSARLTKTVSIPPEFDGKKIFIRINGTSHHAELRVNGKFVRDYWGGFCSWTADITDFVKPGENAQVELCLERTQGLGRFIRFSPSLNEPAEIFAVPDSHIERMRFSTDFDKDYRNATLQLWTKLSVNEGGSLRLSITGPDGKKLSVSPSTIKLPQGMDEFKYDFTVRNPKKWDAEHPNMYHVTLSLLDSKGKVAEVLKEDIGFRKVELRGKQMYINGQEVKFRGLWGSDSPELMRDLNINHTRQKWATEAFLDQSDEYGVYVLDENAIDFAKFGAELDSIYRYQWLNLIAEKIEKDWNHPSVVMWGLGNESFTGENPLATYKYTKAEDPDRPTIYSWGYRVAPDEEIPYDIFSIHYAPIGNPDNKLSDYLVAVQNASNRLYEREVLPEMPTLADESNHVVLSVTELFRDPNVHNFWGESLKNFWDRSWNTTGSLGLDQFGMYRFINETMPEVWHFRKAYSPFVIAQQTFDNPGEGNGLKIEVENRFSHTDLSEITVNWKVGSESGSFKCPAAKPWDKAVMTVPYTHFKDGDILELNAVRADGFQVDEYLLEVNSEKLSIPEPSAVPPTLTETYREVIVAGKDFSAVYNKFSSQFTSVTYKGKTVITGGPHLQFIGSGLAEVEFWPVSQKFYMDGREAVIDLDVVYAPIEVGFQIRIDGEGMFTVHYNIKHSPNPPPAYLTIPWDETHQGGYTEVGVKFTLSPDIDRLSWVRRGLWTTYPEYHIGRTRGTAYKTVENPQYWKDLNYDLYWKRGYEDRRETATNDFRSSKEYIRTADALLKDSSIGVEAFSLEHDAVRMEVAERTGAVTMVINNEWNYPTLGIGNWMKPAIIFGDGYRNTVRFRLVDVSTE